MKNVAALRYLRDAEMAGQAQRVRGDPIDLEKQPEHQLGRSISNALV
jgi:hypothetical protein